MRILVALLCGGLLACGSKSALDPNPFDSDASTDASVDVPTDTPLDTPMDVPTDVPPDVPTDWTLNCPSPSMTIPGEPVESTISSDDATIVDVDFMIRLTPDGATPLLSVLALDTVSFEGDLPGEYVIEANALSDLGTRRQCQFSIAVVDGPPVAVCPADETVANMGESVRIDARAFDDEGPVVSVEWSLIEGPAGAMPMITGQPDGSAFFSSPIGGRYILEMIARDSMGAEDRCRAIVRVTQPPFLMCPDNLEAPTRQPFRVEVGATDEAGPLRHEWEFVGRPDGSAARFSSTDGPNATFTPDRQGRYQLRYRATDMDGLSSECIINVIGTPTPPTLICPEVVTTRPLTETTIEPRVEDDTEGVTVAWRYIEGPDGSDADQPVGAPATRFTPDIAGEYILQASARDSDGMTATCETLVRAVADEGLRVEMFWDTMSDMDVHVLHPESPNWFNESFDCYYATCIPSIEWFEAGPDDNARLDIDNVTGFGPENINIDEPQPGVYRVGVDAFNGRSNVTVRIYCGGSRTEPVEMFGPVNINSESPFKHWKVADVTINADGTCSVEELLNDRGQPDVVSGPAARMSR